MSSPNDTFEIGLAQPSDARQLLELYECGDFEGDVCVLYTRRPDPYRSLMNEGEKAVIPVVRDTRNGVIAGMGACIIRKAYINGEIRSTGYLAGLKELPEYRRRVPAISQTYRYLYDQTKNDVELYYTTILKENTAVQRMLEKKRKSMPEYRRVGEYTVYNFRTGIKTGTRGWLLEQGTLGDLENSGLWNPSAYNFSPPDTALYGLSDKDVYILKDSSGNTAAACALWDQKSWKQYIVTRYSDKYRWLKKIPLRLFGYPDLPREGIPLNYAAVSLLIIREGDLEAAEQLLRKVAEKAVEYDFLMLGLFENNPLTSAMRRLKSIKYQSILYTVHWDDSGPKADGRPVNLEVGLL